MLTLERMEISGFKSFSDRTEVRFPQGITAVVGPNGCGKSNIGDALNWVLGEQSPKQLRGRQMADVIFNGSRARKPLGLAEVSLHFRGSEGLPHCESGTVVITRRLFRSGESDYLINGARARLRDIQELLRRAHVGTKTYATIEQGKIDQVLNARPKDRRLIIEDAAGVAGYKHKRRLTELKLEATEANLLRVNDIVVEVRRQINSLKRQAAKARRYQRLRDDLREKELARFALRARETDVVVDQRRQAETAARDAESGAAAALARLEVEVLDRRTSLDRANRDFRDISTRRHQLEIEAEREENQIRACRERITESEQAAGRHRAEFATLSTRRDELHERRRRLGERLETARRELDEARASLAREQQTLEHEQRALAERRRELESLRDRQFASMHQGAELRNRQRSLEEALERNAAQRTRLESERAAALEEGERLAGRVSELTAEVTSHSTRVEELRAELERCEAALLVARERHGTASESLVEAREQEKSALARLATLEDVATRFAGVSDGVRMLLGAEEEAGVHPRGVIADLIDASADVEQVAEGYLNALLPTVILEDDDEVYRAAEYLRARRAGRTSIISRSQPAGALAVGTRSNGRGQLPSELFEDRRVMGRLRERLEIKTSANGVLHDRLGDAVLVEDLRTALDLHRRFPETDYLTTQGDVVYASGLVTVGGHREGDRGLLAHNRRMHEAAAEGREATGRCAVLQQALERAREAVALAEAEIRQRREALDAGGRRRVELEHETRKSGEDHERARRRAVVLADELTNLEHEAERLHAALRDVAAENAQAEQSATSLGQTLQERLAAIERDDEQVRGIGERVAGLRADVAAREQVFEALDRDRAGLDESAAELDARLAALEQSARREDERGVAARQQLEQSEALLLSHLGEREQLAARIAEMERAIGEQGEQLESHEAELRRARGGLEALREQTRDAEVERARVESDRQHLDDLCRQELGIGAAQALERAAEALDQLDLATLDNEVREIREGIERLGPVNMTAIDEFSELEERYAFLTTQKDDLEKSMGSLKETIRRINRQSREKFQEAFEAIRRSYQEIFALLFNGGHADLRLEEDEDVLECGIEIMAQPPGKRLTSVQLLSGGEKAMSAIALLFAVFRYQPSPFCLLDEVDAPLDDINVGRFARMVREYARQTQFIIITHNKLSMEAADLLYGVTMEEPGVSKLVSLRLQ